MPIYVYTRLVFSWGFSVRPPTLSAGGPSLPLPPPSTLNGALAAGVARVLGWPEAYVAGRGRQLQVYSSAYTLARHLLAAGAWTPSLPVIHRDVTRYSTIPYQTPGNIKDPAQWYGVQNYGLTVAPAGELHAVLIYDDAVRMVGVDERILKVAAYSITRLGAKEALVSVEEVRVGSARETRGGETLLYAPASCLDYAPPTAVEFTAWDPRDPAGYSPGSPTGAERIRFVGVPGSETPLALTGDCASYTGDWPKTLGVVAVLPR